MISVSINGKPHRFETELTVAALIEKMDLVGKRIALERNGEIVPRSRFPEQILTEGDKLEIIVAVGGG